MDAGYWLLVTGYWFLTSSISKTIFKIKKNETATT
jgi:hypothetical protein